MDRAGAGMNDDAAELPLTAGPGRGVMAVWGDAWTAITVNGWLFAAIIIVQSALQAAEIVGALGGAGWLATLIRGWMQIPLIYLALWATIHGGRAPWPWPHFGGLFWRLLILGAPAALVMTGTQSLWLFVPVAMTTGLFALFGTVLPDAVAGGGGFGPALRRGRRTLWRFAKTMAAGPVLAMALALPVVGLIGGGAALAAIRLGIPPGGAETLAPWYALLLSLLGSLTSALMAVLVAAALSDCWRVGNDRPGAGARKT